MTTDITPDRPTDPPPAQPAGLTRRSFLNASLAAVLGVGSASNVSGRAASSGSEPVVPQSILELSALIRAKKVSPVDITQLCLDRIERRNPSLNAFITVTAESALIDARRAESEVQRGNWLGPLHGIPIALKDLIDTAGVRTTCGSAWFKDRIPQQDAVVVERLRSAGAVFLGKLNMQEFAYGGTSVPSYFGRVCNPWDLERIAGGSSGGPAAAVAAGLCYGALGSDTGGSVREPAALCGIVGLKPTFGRVSNRGVVPLSGSLDHIGPMTRTVADAALILQVIAGYDPKDPVSQDRPVDSYLPDARAQRLHLRIGVPREYFYPDLDPDVAAAVDQALAVLASLGGELRDVPIEVSTDRTVFRAEAYSYHANMLARSPELYLPETLAKLRLGADITTRAYIQARRELEALQRSVLRTFALCDVIATPTTAVPATKAADYPTTIDGALSLDGRLLRNTRPFNAYGFPTMSIPCGITRGGLPIGLQLAAPPWAERRLLACARAFEEATDWHRRSPPAST